MGTVANVVRATEVDGQFTCRLLVEQRIRFLTGTAVVVPVRTVEALLFQRENERAVELYALSSRFPVVAKSRWFADVAGERLAAVAGTLPTERVAFLEERGRASDLEATVAKLLAELCQ